MALSIELLLLCFAKLYLGPADLLPWSMSLITPISVAVGLPWKATGSLATVKKGEYKHTFLVIENSAGPVGMTLTRPAVVTKNGLLRIEDALNLGRLSVVVVGPNI